MEFGLDREIILPEDGCNGTLIGRAWVPGDPGGPSVVVLAEHGVYDIGASYPTCSALLEAEDPVAAALSADMVRVGSIDALLANSVAGRRDPAKPSFLAPIDLQAVKACGVTFLDSLMERVIEELAKGEAAAAEEVRRTIGREIGADLGGIRPGSEEAMRLKEALIARKLWSPYLEVGIGPDAEVFTKAQPMSAVGLGAEIGVPSFSSWNNPEPEAVVVVNSRGEVVGATLGNDVNLRDVEGRSALLLGKAKDNNASCAVGPFIRLFDNSFTFDDLKGIDVSLAVEGDDGFTLTGASSMRLISRDPLDLVRQTIGPTHQYPDGFVLFTGTMFAPTEDRGEKGRGFPHKAGDVVTIASPPLGALINRVNNCEDVEPWTFGVGALIRNLSDRRLL